METCLQYTKGNAPNSKPFGAMRLEIDDAAPAESGRFVYHFRAAAFVGRSAPSVDVKRRFGRSYITWFFVVTPPLVRVSVVRFVRYAGVFLKLADVQKAYWIFHTLGSEMRHEQRSRDANDNSKESAKKSGTNPREPEFAFFDHSSAVLFEFGCG